TGVGIEEISAAHFPQNDLILARPATPPIIQVEYTRVIASTPIFSPYVVLGVDPSKLEIIVDIPLPISERSRPGSLTRSFFTIFPVTTRWPICSGMSTIAAGKMMSISAQLNFI